MTIEQLIGNTPLVEYQRLHTNPKVKISARAHKMSKSRGNVVNPDDIVGAYGADSLRLYEMFMGPLRETKVWQTKGVEGCFRFLARTYRLLDKVTDENRTRRVVARCTSASPR